VGGGGGVAAWFPLGPGEVYRPAYHVSEVYVRQVNITHVTNINVVNVTNVTNVRYVNQNVQGAVTVVPHEAFISSRPVAQVSVRVDARVVAQAQVVGTTAQVAPRRESVMAHSGPAVAGPPARFADRAVVARTAPPAPPVSFAAKQQALQANQGRPLAPEQTRNLRTNTPAPRPMVRTVAPAGRAPQSQPVMTPRPQPAVAQPAAPSVQHNDRPAQAPQREVAQPAPTPRPQPAVVQPAAPNIQHIDRPAQAPQREVRETPREQPVTAHPAPEARHEAAQQPKEEKKQPGKKADKKEEKKQ
jgi:hypothetical protein